MEDYKKIIELLELGNPVEATRKNGKIDIFINKNWNLYNKMDNCVYLKTDIDNIIYEYINSIKIRSNDEKLEIINKLLREYDYWFGHMEDIEGSSHNKLVEFIKELCEIMDVWYIQVWETFYWYKMSSKNPL